MLANLKVGIAIVSDPDRKLQSKYQLFTVGENIIATNKMRNNFYYPLKW